nr:probable LRR receptor-like serine/threonine-protein kinase At3g47570 [Ipomoea batatas]
MCDNIITPALQGLYLSYNNLEGEIPASLSKCFALQILSLSYNRFRGQIPPQIGNLTDLEVLYLGGNLLTGEIPQEIGNLNSMLGLALESNQIMGSIPAGIFNNMTFLIVLYLYGNSLSGTLPANICHNFSGLELLDLDTNQLYGRIPGMLHMCTNLQELDLGSNSFTVCYPFCKQEVKWLGYGCCLFSYLTSYRFNFSRPHLLNILLHLLTPSCALTYPIISSSIPHHPLLLGFL